MSRIIKKILEVKKEEAKKKKKYKDDFRSKLGFRLHDITMSKEESVTTKITKAFSTEKILPQHSILSYQIDLDSPKNELTIKVDEKVTLTEMKKNK